MNSEFNIIIYLGVLLTALILLILISKISKDKIDKYFMQNGKIYTFLVFLIMGLTLPFHYYPSQLMIFPKKSLTFRHTIITESTVEKLVLRYNNAGLIEKIALRNEPLTRSLLEKGIIRDN